MCKKSSNLSDNILDVYNSWKEVPAAVKAWVTIKAKKEGKNPVMKKAGIKAAFSKRANAKKVTKIQIDCAVCPYKFRFEEISKITK